jgi:hypothetical protein
MARTFAGAALNYTPDQLQKVFGPGRLTFDTTDRFDIGSLEVPSTKNNRLSDALNQLKQSGVDPNSLTGAFFMQQAGVPTTAEQLATIIPLYERLDKSRADLADRNAQRKFGQEMLAAGFGSLQTGLRASIAGGSPEMLAYMAQGPVRAAEAYQRGITSIPRQDVPVFAARPTPDRRYFS